MTLDFIIKIKLREKKMKHFLIIAALLFAATCSAFHVASKQSSTSMRLSARSKSVPFLDQPKALNGKLPGDVGFDPLGLSNIWEGVSLIIDLILSYSYIYLITVVNRETGVKMLFQTFGQNLSNVPQSPLFNG